MVSARSEPGPLGTTFLFVASVSLASGLLHDSALGAPSTSGFLASAPSNATPLRIATPEQLITSAGVVAVASLPYGVLVERHRLLALVALG